MPWMTRTDARSSAMMILPLAILLIVAPAAALDDAAAPPPSEPNLLHLGDTQFHFEVTAGVWLPRLGGDSKLGAGNAFISFESQLDLDNNQEAALNVEALLTVNDHWQVFVSGFGFSSDDAGAFSGSASFGAVSFADGDPYRVDVEITSIGGEVLYPVYSPLGSLAGPDPGDPASITFSALGGLRWIEVDQMVERTTPFAQTTEGGDWIALYGGVSMNLQYLPRDTIPFLKKFVIDTSGAIGPALNNDGGFVWQVRAGTQFYFTENLAFTFGYRLLEMNLEDGGYEFDAGLQGLFFAGTVRF
jgi:hypothetical protein